MMTTLNHQPIQPVKPTVAREPGIVPQRAKQVAEAYEPPTAEKTAPRAVPGYWNPLAKVYQSEDELWAWCGNWDL